MSSEDGEEKTQKEVADMLGISQSYISRLEKKNNASVKKKKWLKVVDIYPFLMDNSTRNINGVL